MSTANFFSKPLPKTVTGSAGFVKGDKKAKWLSPFIDMKSTPFNFMTIKPGQDTLVRLIPTFSSLDTGYTLNVKTVGVKYKDPTTGTTTDGMILAGTWWDKVEQWLLANYRERMHSFSKNPTGDLKLRAKVRVIFWVAAMISPEEGKDAIPTLRLVNLAGTNYKGGPAGDGDQFGPGGDFYEDFDPEQGRDIMIRATLKNPNDNTSKTYRFNPSRTAVPIDPKWLSAIPEEWMNNPAETRPSLVGMQRQSSSEEIQAALEASLPADIFAKLMEVVGQGGFKY